MAIDPEAFFNAVWPMVSDKATEVLIVEWKMRSAGMSGSGTSFQCGPASLTRAPGA